MRSVKDWVLCAGLWAASAAVAAGQTGIYGEFSAAKLTSNTGWLFGPTVGFYHDRGEGLFAYGYDVRGSFVHGGTENLDSVLAGGRLALTPHILPVKPYGEVLGGFGHYSDGSSNYSNRFEYQFLGGLDLTVFPHVDWRVAEFSYGGLAVLNIAQHPKTLSTGIVFRLP